MESTRSANVLLSSGIAIAILLWLLPTAAVWGQEADGGFLLSGPRASRAPARPEVTGESNLQQLIDARGLALLIGDDEVARSFEHLVGGWRKFYRERLAGDEQLRRWQQQIDTLFASMLEDPRRPVAELRRVVAGSSLEQRAAVVSRWLRNIFWKQGVLFPRDLARLTAGERSQLCQKLRTAVQPRLMESWRLRVLVWLLRDRQVLRLSARRDERLAELTPVSLADCPPQQRQLLQRYLDMLANLHRQATAQKEPGRRRTLRGLLRGLRYMDTIRQASAIAGLDHRLVTRLLIQESAFIHQRVSWAGAFSLAQFLNIALKDIWQFRRRIPGAGRLLAGVSSYRQLRRQVIADPRMAIRAACVYFRRLRDEVVLRLGDKGRHMSDEMLTLLSLELYLLRNGMGQMATFDSLVESRLSWPQEQLVLPLVPAAGGMLPDPATLLGGWMKGLIRRLVERKVSRAVFQGRLARLHQALGLAAYNAGMRNLIRAAKRRGPLGPLSFPLELDETRNYVDDILDGIDLLSRVDRLASPLHDMDYRQLLKLARRTCGGDDSAWTLPASPVPAQK